MGKKKKSDDVIGGKIIQDDEIVEMAEYEPGKFMPVAIRKIQPRILPEIPMQFGGFRGPPPNINMMGGSRMNQLLNGFIIGMDIVEKFLDRVEMVKKNRRR